MEKKMIQYKVNFTTRYGTPIFGTVPDIIMESDLAGLHIKFIGGGWNAGDIDLCYHEWETYEEEGRLKDFFSQQYGQSYLGMELIYFGEKAQGVA